MIPALKKSSDVNSVNSKLLGMIKPDNNEPVQIEMQFDGKDNSVNTIKEKNNIYKLVNEKFCKFDFRIDIEKMSIDFQFNIDPKYAQKVDQIINSYKIYRAFITKEIKMNGISLFEDIFKIKQEAPLDKIDDIDAIIEYWEKIHEIESALGCRFRPRDIIGKNESELIEKLYRTLIIMQPYKEYLESFDDFNVTVDVGFDTKGILEKDELSFMMLQENKIRLYKTKHDLYAAIGIYNMRIVSLKVIKENNHNKVLALKTKPARGQKMYISTMLFKEVNEAKKYLENKNNLNKLSNANEL